MYTGMHTRTGSTPMNTSKDPGQSAPTLTTPKRVPWVIAFTGNISVLGVSFQDSVFVDN